MFYTAVDDVPERIESEIKQSFDVCVFASATQTASRTRSEHKPGRRDLDSPQGDLTTLHFSTNELAAFAAALPSGKG